MRGRMVRTTDRAGGGDAAARLTRCQGTWLALPPDRDEQQRISEASRQLRGQRQIATEFYHDPEATNAFCIELFRGEEFAPLHIAPPVIERIIGRIGEPPVVQEGEDQQPFSDYLARAVLDFAIPDNRRLLAAQLRRYLPRVVEAGRWREAVAIDYSAFRTALGNEVTPFLAQMTLAGLADYYDEVED